METHIDFFDVQSILFFRILHHARVAIRTVDIYGRWVLLPNQIDCLLDAGYKRKWLHLDKYIINFLLLIRVLVDKMTDVRVF